MQTTFYNSKFTRREFPIIVLTDQVQSDLNIGSLFRVCDAFGVQRLIITGLNGTLGRKVRKTSRSTEQIVNFEFSKNGSQTVKDLKNHGYRIVCIEITQKSIPMHTFSFTKNEAMVIIVGDERFGISDDILTLADDILHIEMFGMNSSMNVVQAASIALYEITRQLL